MLTFITSLELFGAFGAMTSPSSLLIVLMDWTANLPVPAVVAEIAKLATSLPEPSLTV